MLLHWNTNPSKRTDEGDRFIMSTESGDVSIVNLLGTSGLGNNCIDVHSSTLACGTDAQSIVLFNL